MEIQRRERAVKILLPFLFIYIFCSCSITDPDIPEYGSYNPGVLPDVKLKVLNMHSHQCDMQLTFSNMGKVSLTGLKICYSTTNEEPDITCSIVDVFHLYKENATSLEVTLFDLDPDAIHYCRVYAVNQESEKYTEPSFFSTKSPSNNYSWENVMSTMPLETEPYSYRIFTVNERVFAMHYYYWDGYYVGGFWEFSPSERVWIPKRDIPWEWQGSLVHFSTEKNLYVGLYRWFREVNEYGNTVYRNTYYWWCYDPETDAWERKKETPEIINYNPFVTSVNGKGFLLFRQDKIESGVYKIQVMEYNPVNDEWLHRGASPDEVYSIDNVFAIGNCIYAHVYLPDDDNLYLWEYNPEISQWKKKTSFSGGRRENQSYTATKTKGYTGFGRTYIPNDESSVHNFVDWWEYSPETDRWMQCSVDNKWSTFFINFSFSMNDTVYVGGGYPYGLWKYNGEKIPK